MEALGVVTNRASRAAWTLPSWGSRTHRFPLFACSKKDRDDNVHTYTITTRWSHHLSILLLSYRSFRGPIVWRCMYRVRIRGFLPSRRDYVRIRLQLHHFPAPFRGGGCFSVVVTHVDGGRSAPPGVEASRSSTGASSFTLTFSWSVRSVMRPRSSGIPLVTGSDQGEGIAITVYLCTAA